MITLSPIAGGKGADQILHHDLNFGQEDYEASHKVTFKNPKPELMERLKDTGPVPGEGANGVRGAAGGSAKKRKGNNVDMDKLAEGLQQLGEDDLLNVVQMVCSTPLPPSLPSLSCSLPPPRARDANGNL